MRILLRVQSICSRQPVGLLRFAWLLNLWGEKMNLHVLRNMLRILHIFYFPVSATRLNDRNSEINLPLAV
jgi:hypothetical protein